MPMNEGGNAGTTARTELAAKRRVLAAMGVDYEVGASGNPNFAHGPLLYEFEAGGAWLAVSTTLVDPRSPAFDPGNMLGDGLGDEDPFAEVADAICREVLLAKAVANGFRLQLQAAFLLCGAGLPAAHDAGGAELPAVEPLQATAAVTVGMSMVNGAVAFARARLGPPDAERPADPPFAPGITFHQAAPLLRAAAAAAGMAWHDAGEPGRPLAFLFDQGWVFRVQLQGDGLGVFALAVDFVEDDRYVAATDVANVVAATLDDGLADACRDATARYVGIKAWVSPERGLVSFVLAGFLPRGEIPSAVDGLVQGCAMLRGAAQAVFASAKIDWMTHAQASMRPPVDPSAQLLVRRERSIGHPWERRSARLLAEGVTGQAGWLLTGFSLPARRGEVNVDHVLVCHAGLFAIECKSHSGVIRGARNGPWFQDLRRGRLKLSGPRDGNPADQSALQVIALRTFLDQALEQTPADRTDLFVRGIVLFPANAKLQLANVPVNRLSGTAAAAFNVDHFIALLNAWEAPPSLSREQIEIVAAIIRQS